MAGGPGGGRAAAPVRLVHLGLGNFFRAHQAWYTDHAGDAAGEWGYAAFTGRRAEPAVALAGQDGLYTLITRGPERDTFEVIGSLSRAYAADEHQAWLDHLASPEVAAVTITLTEAGYLRRPGGGLDLGRPEVQADLDALRRDPAAPVHTAPARLVAGIMARWQAGAGPLALVPCDNVPANGAMVARVVADFAEALDPRLPARLADSVSVVTTMVDRITPRPVAGDADRVRDAIGFADIAPVVTEPFTEWVLSGDFPAGRPAWDAAGATFTGDIGPFERRKLWLLNGAHSLLAYAGSLRGHATVAEAIADDTCQPWVASWWDEAARHLTQPAYDLARYRDTLLERFANGRMRHRLSQIAADGSQKLPIRILPVLAAERCAGREPQGATRVLAAWVCHLRGLGAPVSDVRADELRRLASGPLPDAVRRVLASLDPALGEDTEVVTLACSQAQELAGQRTSR